MQLNKCRMSADSSLSLRLRADWPISKFAETTSENLTYNQISPQTGG